MISSARASLRMIRVRPICALSTHLKIAARQAVILGCTEIDLLIGENDTDMPLFDSTALHVDDAVEWMLG